MITFIQRPFSGEADLQAMIALARTDPESNLHVVDLPYRLSSWALDDPGNIALWADPDERLLAWAVLQAPFWTLDYAYQPALGEDLHPQILAWADHRAHHLLNTPSGRPCWFVMCFPTQLTRIRDLEDAGFASQGDVGQDSWSKVLMARPVHTPLEDFSPPQGFAIRPLGGIREVGDYVALHRLVFESRNMTPEWRARTLRRPEYIPALDLVAVSQEGTLAGFCIAWLSETKEGVVGQVEPLGVHPDFRDLGLGRALITQVLKRLYHLGAIKVYVETDNYRDAALELYESVGFQVIKDVLVYRKDY